MFKLIPYIKNAWELAIESVLGIIAKDYTVGSSDKIASQGYIHVDHLQ